MTVLAESVARLVHFAYELVPLSSPFSEARQTPERERSGGGEAYDDGGQTSEVGGKGLALTPGEQRAAAHGEPIEERSDASNGDGDQHTRKPVGRTAEPVYDEVQRLDDTRQYDRDDENRQPQRFHAAQRLGDCAIEARGKGAK